MDMLFLKVLNLTFMMSNSLKCLFIPARRVFCDFKMPKLSTEINLKFVQLYGEHECLWNAALPIYRDKNKRDSALQKICGEIKTLGIDMTTKDVKSKIKNLRATYSQELTKIDKSTRSGAGSQEEYKSKLNWFQEMHSFIKNVPMKRKTTVRYLQSFINY